MNWKVFAIILLVVVILLGAYSYGLFPSEEVEEGTAEVAGSFDVSGSVQSDFWDGFTAWLFDNLFKLVLIGGATYLCIYFIKSRA